MKFAPLLLIVVVAVATTGCNTVNTRRDLYSPTKGKGYWTKVWEEEERPLDNAANPGPESGFFGFSHPAYERHERESAYQVEPGSETGIFGVSHSRHRRHYHR